MARNFDSVRTSLDLYRNERKQAYSDEGKATWREHITNAADAIYKAGRVASGRIDCEITPINDLVTRIVVADNGVGMDEQTIRNVFMVLGKTTKDEHGDQGGGFGRARLLTHFSQYKYHIYTRDLHVVGVGDRYVIVPNPLGFTDGCIMEVYVENKTRWNETINWDYKLRNFLGLCQMPFTVTINGERFTNWLYKRRCARTLPFGTIHANLSAESSYVTVRVNGTCMFQEYVTGLKNQVILELCPKTSRDMLTSNRDGFNQHHYKVWSDFLRDLTKDAKSAVEEESNKIEVVGGTGAFEHHVGEHSVVLEDAWFASDETIDSTHSSFGGGGVTVVTNPMAEILGSPNQYRDDSPSLPSVVPNTGVPSNANVVEGELRMLPLTITQNFSPVGGEEIRSAVETPVLEAPVEPKPEKRRLRHRFFSIIVNDNTACIENAQWKKKARKLIPSYHPDSWHVIDRPGQGQTVEGGSKAKLLLAWKTLCHFVVDEFLTMESRQSIRWGVGWLFGPDTAECREHDGAQWMLLNPLFPDGKMRYSATKNEDMIQLLLLAIHQITHVGEKYHDLDFIVLQERLTARVLKRLPEIKRAVKKISRVKLA